MKNLIIIAIISIFLACAKKPVFKGKVVAVSWNNTAKVLTKTPFGEDTLVYCSPKSKYERFVVGEQLSLVWKMGRYQSN
jgi:hypothetical protein